MKATLFAFQTASLTLAICFASTTHAAPVTFDWATVGNPGNAGELSGSGAGGFGPDVTVGGVDYTYRISKTEVTNAQYVEFLNAVATTDLYGLYISFMRYNTRAGITRSGSSGSFSYSVKADAAGQGPNGSDYTYGDKPVVFVSWYDSVRFINWLHNGQGNGDTETGAYTLLGGTATPSNGLSITRNADATYWLPSGDEWYKAAYYDNVAGTYFDYATGTDTPPNNNLSTADTGNSANYNELSPFGNGYTNGTSSYPMTDIGAYAMSKSPYGTYDQNGNAREWNEGFVSWGSRSNRGGSWWSSSDSLAASVRSGSGSSAESSTIGFRVASIPEPSSLLLGALASMGLLMRRRRLG